MNLLLLDKEQKAVLDWRLRAILDDKEKALELLKLLTEQHQKLSKEPPQH